MSAATVNTARPLTTAPGRLARARAEMPARARLSLVAPVVRTGSVGFSLLCLMLVLAAMLGGLLVNTARAEGSFHIAELRQQQTELTERRTQLESDIVGLSAPDRLAERARSMGMVPAGQSAYIAEDGTVIGVAEAAQPETSPTVDPDAAGR